MKLESGVWQPSEGALHISDNDRKARSERNRTLSMKENNRILY